MRAKAPPNLLKVAIRISSAQAGAAGGNIDIQTTPDSKGGTDIDIGFLLIIQCAFLETTKLLNVHRA